VYLSLTVDYILITSDSGRLSIIEFLVAPTPHFESLFQEVYGKTGTRLVLLTNRLTTDVWYPDNI
jgi:splicing factor 3B subunit 3